MLTYDVFLENYPEIRISKLAYTRIYNILISKINYVTFNRIDFNNEKEINTFKILLESILIDLYDKGILEDNTNSPNDVDPNVKSESIGEYKKEYFDTSKKTNKWENEEFINGINKLIYNHIKETYAHTGLMYRGNY